jgi:hypothetical protein
MLPSARMLSTVATNTENNTSIHVPFLLGLWGHVTHSLLNHLVGTLEAGRAPLAVPRPAMLPPPAVGTNAAIGKLRASARPSGSSKIMKATPAPLGSPAMGSWRRKRPPDWPGSSDVAHGAPASTPLCCCDGPERERLRLPRVRPPDAAGDRAQPRDA